MLGTGDRWEGTLPIVALVLVLSATPAASGTQSPASPVGALEAPKAPVLLSLHASTFTPHLAPAALSPLSYVWSPATVFYGQGDPEGLLFGEGAVMAVDDRLQNTVSYGGHGLWGLSNITMVYDNASNGTWWWAGSPVLPPARANATFASDPVLGLAVLFGGLTNLNTSATVNDTWVYYFGNETWVNSTRLFGPPDRENAAFAVDPGTGTGLLFGGITPRYARGNSTGTILWNDTWEINLTTLVWAPVSLRASPPPLYGSSMVWDPVSKEFVLFGGCDTSRCSANLWTYAPGSSQWREVTAGGTGPSGRGSAAFVWDTLDNVTLLFGGFEPGALGPVALGDTYYLDAGVTSWSPVLSTGGPPPTYGSASAFSDYPGCVGMWVQGGSPALDGIIFNVSVLEPTSSLRPNCFTPFGGGTGGGPPPPCSNTSAHLEVQVLDAATGAGLIGAGVTVSGSCGTSHGSTGAAGFLNLTEAAPDLLTVSADRAGYHPDTLSVNYTGAPGRVVRLALEAFPSLSTRVFGTSRLGTFPLANATVSTNSAVVVGMTNPAGWVNATGVASLTAQLTVQASAVDFSTSAVTVSLPYSGVVYANLTLLAFGALDIEIRDNYTGMPIPGASVALSFVDPLGANTSEFRTASDGWLNQSVKAGNYSILASSPGHFANGTNGSVFHPWIEPTIVVIELARVYGADVHVHVFDASTGYPVAQASVSLGGATSLFSTPTGWTNASNLGPPGLLRIQVSAWGYYPNSTTVTIQPYVVLSDVEVGLHPAPPCSPYASCPPQNATSPPPALSLLPPPGTERTLLLLAPLALAIAGGLVVALRRASRWAVRDDSGSDTLSKHPPRPIPRG